MAKKEGLKYSQGDTYCYSGTDVLINIPGITTQQELDSFETEISAIRMLDDSLIYGGFDAAHFKLIHWNAFQDVYTWAGKYRTCSISKGSSVFCQPQFIAEHVEKCCTDIQQAMVKDLSREELIDLLTKTTADLNAYHPFREGNGRTIREFISQIASHQGYYFDMMRIDKKEWVEASIQSFNGDMQLLKSIFDSCIK